VKGDHAFAVKTVSHPLSRLMKLWFGDNATNKHFPKWVFKTSEGFWKSMIKGLWIGDGYCTYSGKYKYPCFGLNTASKELALQTFAILIGLGVRPTLRRYIQPNSAFGRGNPIYVVKVLNDVDRMASIIGVNVPKTRKQEHIRSFFHDGKLWFKVDQIKKLNYEGDVYDLTVEPSNSYILEGMVVHNSEDFYFCQRAIDAGFKILVDTGHVVPHIMEAKVVEDGKLEGLSF
jgi:intein/homing endonuclease